MNEQVKLLAEQAMSATFNKFSGVEWSAEEWRNFYDTKFAELIVRECVEQSMSIGRYNTPSGITPDLSIAIAVGLKKHFGVEE